MLRVFWFLWLAGPLLAAFGLGGASAAPPQVELLKVDGTIVPVMGDYIDRGLSQAESRGVPCIIELNTPGGLYGETPPTRSLWAPQERGFQRPKRRR